MLKMLLEELQMEILKTIYTADIPDRNKELIVNGIKHTISYFTQDRRWDMQQEIDDRVEDGIADIKYEKRQEFRTQITNAINSVLRKIHEKKHYDSKTGFISFLNALENELEATIP